MLERNALSICVRECITGRESVAATWKIVHLLLFAVVYKTWVDIRNDIIIADIYLVDIFFGKYNFFSVKHRRLKKQCVLI